LILCFRKNCTTIQLLFTTYPTKVKNEPTDNTESTTFLNYSENDYENKFICNDCYTLFNDFEEFVIHRNLSHKNKPYVCDICKAQFVLSAHLNLHLDKNVKDRCWGNSFVNPSKMQCSSISNLTINQSHTINNNNSNIPKFHQCQFCMKIFKNILLLNNHLQYDTHRIEKI